MGTPATDRNKLVVTQRFHVVPQPDGDVVADDLELVVVGRQDDGGARADARVGTEGIAIAGNHSTATAGIYGIAIAGKAGTATCGPAGAAIAHDDSRVIAADGSIAFVRAYRGHATAASFGAAAICSHDGIAEVARTGFASVESGTATGGGWSIASLREDGAVTAGPGGVAIGWNRVRATTTGTPGSPPTINLRDDLADSDLLKAISAGNGGLIISFYMDDHGRRQPVVGFVGDIDIKAQGGLKPNQAYRVSKDGQFVPA